MRNPLDNWSDRAIIADVTDDAKGFWLKCPWCNEHHEVVLGRYVVKGHHICRACAQFFGFEVDPVTGNARTWKAKAKPKLLPTGG